MHFDSVSNQHKVVSSHTSESGFAIVIKSLTNPKLEYGPFPMTRMSHLGLDMYQFSYKNKSHSVYFFM